MIQGGEGSGSEEDIQDEGSKRYPNINFQILLLSAKMNLVIQS